MPKFTEEEMHSILTTSLDLAVIGSPGSRSCHHLAEDYLDQYEHPAKAARSYVENQARRESSNGFIAGLGGFLTRIENDEVSIAGALNVQVKMISTVAAIANADLLDPGVQSKVVACLCKAPSQQMRELMAQCHLSEEDIVCLRQLCAKHLADHYSKSDYKSLLKTVPLAGGLARISMDYRRTMEIGKTAISTFLFE